MEGLSWKLTVIFIFGTTRVQFASVVPSRHVLREMNTARQRLHASGDEGGFLEMEQVDPLWVH